MKKKLLSILVASILVTVMLVSIVIININTNKNETKYNNELKKAKDDKKEPEKTPKKS